MKSELTKRQRAMMRELGATTQERELRALLTPLGELFAQWRDEKVDVLSLLDEIDKLKPLRRELERRYSHGDLLPMMIGRAVAAGHLREEEVPAELQTLQKEHIEYFRRGDADVSTGMEEAD